jgi:hypothetical protein
LLYGANLHQSGAIRASASVSDARSFQRRFLRADKFVARMPAGFGNNATLGGLHDCHIRVALELLAHEEYLSPSLPVWQVIGGCTE